MIERLRELHSEFGECPLVIDDPVQDGWADEVADIWFDQDRQAIVVTRADD